MAEEAKRYASRHTRMERLEQEYGNLRAALQWLIEQEESELALRLCTDLLSFWRRRGYLSEGRQWLEKALAMNNQEDMLQLRARALKDAAWLIMLQDDYTHAEVLLNEGLRLYRDLAARSPGEATFKRGLAYTLDGLGHVARLGKSDYATARALQEESLALAREVGTLDANNNLQPSVTYVEPLPSIPPSTAYTLFPPKGENNLFSFW